MKVMIRFILPSTDTPWQKAEELGLKDKLAMKVGNVMMIVMMVAMKVGSDGYMVTMKVGTLMIVMMVVMKVGTVIIVMIVMKVDSDLSCC